MIPTSNQARRVPLAIAIAYALVSAAWIFFSDRLLALFVGNYSAYQTLQTYKGWAFITVSALVLFLALRYAWQRLEQANALLDLASDLAKLGGWRSDLAARKVEATRGAYAAYGMPDGPFDVAKAMACFDPSDREILDADRAEAIRNRVVRINDFAITDLEGTQKWVRVIQRAQIGPGKDVVGVAGAVQDISEIIVLRREMENQALRLRNMFDNLPDGFFLLDHDLRFTFANAKAEEFIANARGTGPDYLGKTLWEVFPRVASQLREPVAHLQRDGEPIDLLLEIPGTKEFRRIVSFSTPDGIGTHLRDVTEEVRAQNKLQESEERFRLASIASQDVLFDWDGVHDRLTWSDAARHRYGYDPDVFPKSLVDLFGRIHPDDRARVTANATQSLQPGGPDNWTENYRLLTADGGVAHVLERGLSLRDSNGRTVRSVGTITDVTAMHQEEQRLRAVVAVAADAIFEYDPKRRVVSYSDGIRTTFGHDWVGEHPTSSLWEEAVHPDERVKLTDSFRAFCAGPEILWRCEYRMARGDGQFANVRERVLAIRDETGGLVRVIGSMEDVTQERRAEDQLKQAERIQAIGTLTGGVAHDFNNLLTVILGNAELLEADDTISARTRNLAAAILKAAERGAELTSSLLTVAGKHAMAPKPVDCSAILAEIAQLLERTLPANIALQINCQPDLWLVETDSAQMNAALLNLIANARDSMPEGGTLLIDCANETLTRTGEDAEAAAPAGEFVCITVTDTGTGMAPEVVERAFEPFYTTKSRGVGTGLGLSIVHGFLQQSGGHVKITTAPGEGTAISLFLPRCSTERSAILDEPAHTASPVQGHVLIVEDNALLLPHVMDIVAGLGYRVSSAADGKAALAILRETDDVDVLFTDVVLPGDLNGPSLAKLALEARPDLRVLFTSGYTENATVHHGRLDREVHLLSKPYRRNELARMLRKVIEEA